MCTFRKELPIWWVLLQLMIDRLYKTLAGKVFACCFALGVFIKWCGSVVMVTSGGGQHV